MSKKDKEHTESAQVEEVRLQPDGVAVRVDETFGARRQPPDLLRRHLTTERRREAEDTDLHVMSVTVRGVKTG